MTARRNRKTTFARGGLVMAWIGSTVVAGAIGFVAAGRSGFADRVAEDLDEQNGTTARRQHEVAPPASPEKTIGNDLNAFRDIFHEQDADLRRFRLEEAVRDCHASEMPAVLAAVLALPASSRRDQFVKVIYTRWGEIAPLQAFESIDHLSTSMREPYVSAVLGGWSEVSVDAAFAWLESHRIANPHGPYSEQIAHRRRCTSFIDAQIKAGRIEALIHVIEGVADDEFKKSACAQVVPHWLEYDLDAAMAWLGALPPSGLKDSVVSRAVTWFANEEPELAAGYAMQLPAEKDRVSTLRAVVETWAERGDLSSAQTWLARQPRSLETDDVLSKFVEAVVVRDRDVAAAAVRLLSDSDHRFEAVARAGDQLARTAPAAAIDWILQFDEPERRSTIVSHLFHDWARRDPTAAAAYLDSAGGLTAEEAAQLRAMLKPRAAGGR